MSQVKVDIVVTRRWFYWPCAVAIMILARLSLVRHEEAAWDWLVDNAIRMEIR